MGLPHLMRHMVFHEWTWKTGVLSTELPSFPLQVQFLVGKVFLHVRIFANKPPIITCVWHHHFPLTRVNESATVMSTIGPMVVPNPVIAARETLLRSPISLSGNTQADDTQSYSGLGAVRNVGLQLGRILNNLEVPDTHMWAISAFVPVLSIADPRDGMGQGATVPTCGPLLILSPCGALGAHETAGVGSQCAHMWAISDFVLVLNIGDPRGGGG